MILKNEIVDVADMDGYTQECQSGVSVELASLDCRSFGVEDAVEGLVAESFLFVVEKVDIEQDFGMFDGFVERDIDWHRPLMTECAGTAIAQGMIWLESVIHFEVELESAEGGEVDLDSCSLGTPLVKHKGRLVVQCSLAKGVCPVRLAEDGCSLESPAGGASVLA